MDIHDRKRRETNNMQPQHKIDQVVNNPISSNSEQNRDAFRENYSLYINNVQFFREWLEKQAKVLERLQAEHSFLGTRFWGRQRSKIRNLTQKIKRLRELNKTLKMVWHQYDNQIAISFQKVLQLFNKHFLAYCPRYQSLAPAEKYNLVKQHKLCINCWSSRHSRNTCTSERRCQQCRGFHHTWLHDPSRFTSTNSASYTALVSGKNEDENDKEFTTANSCRYGQSHRIDKNTHHQQKQADNEFLFFNGGFTALEKATFERLRIIWFEQLQLIPMSFVNNGKVCDTYALIDPGSQFIFAWSNCRLLGNLINRNSKQFLTIYEYQPWDDGCKTRQNR